MTDAIKQYLATKPGSLGLADKLKQLEAENAELEAAIAKVEKNRDTILREKRMLEGQPEKALRGNGQELFITRSAARDPQAYARMKEVAAEQGKSVRIIEDDIPNSNDGPPQASPVGYLEDRTRGILFINVQERDRPGVGPMRAREIAAERGLKEARPFRDVRDLPADMRQAHQQALVDSEGLLDV